MQNCFIKNTKIADLGNFGNIKCHGGFYLDGSRFQHGGLVIFDESSFYGPASFRDVAFPSLSFGNVKFNNNTFFRGAIFDGDANFQGAVFLSDVDFNSCDFKAGAIFRSAEFKSIPTIFDTKFTELVEFFGASWPGRPKDKIEALNQMFRYQRLKREMDRLGRPHEAQDFFIKELCATREIWPRYSPRRILFMLYEIFSNYGESVRRPFLWLCFSFVAGSLLFYIVPICNHTNLSYYDAINVSLNNMITFLPYKPNPEITACIPFAAKLFGDLQSLLGIVLLFLLGLGLRNRFRMK